MTAIFTGETIQDIPDVARGILPEVRTRHAELFRESGGAGRVIGTILAENWHILVQEDTGKQGYNDPDPDYQVPIFGDLYPMITGAVEDTDGMRFKTFAFLSDSETNAMLEDIGLKPGEDVVSFQLVPDSDFSAARTHEFARKRVHAISADPSFFYHDRGSVHVPGAFTKHPKLLSKISKLAMKTDPESARGERIACASHDLDTYLSILANKVYETGERANVMKKAFAYLPGIFRHPGVPFLESGHTPVLRTIELALMQKERYIQLEELVATNRNKRGH